MKVRPTEVDQVSTKIKERLVIQTALPDGNIDFFNRRCLEYLGLTLNDVQGRRWTPPSVGPKNRLSSYS
jgi:PAS domain-containing protein